MTTRTWHIASHERFLHRKTKLQNVKHLLQKILTELSIVLYTGNEQEKWPLNIFLQMLGTIGPTEHAAGSDPLFFCVVLGSSSSSSSSSTSHYVHAGGRYS